MISLREVERQLEHVGCNYKIWGRSEIKELGGVLMPDEAIAQAVNGTYEGGFALLTVTNYRVLLIDRKPMILTIEDMRYDMIAEVDFHNHLFGATLRILTPMRNLVFSSWSNLRLRKCMSYVQQRVMEIRHQNFMPQLSSTVGVPQPLSVLGAAPEAPGVNAVSYAPINPYTKAPMLSRHRNRFPTV